MASDWNDLKYFLAIHETGSLAGASRILRVDETTVGRRLTALEGALGAKLFERKRNGYEPTAEGLKVLEAALPVREKLSALETSIEGSDKTLSGRVRLALPETIATHLVLPVLSSFVVRHPEIQLEFLTSAHILNIAKREADIAIRMVRPSQSSLYTRKLGVIEFKAYASRKYWETVEGKGESNGVHLVDYPDSEATEKEQGLLKQLRKSCRSRVQVTNRFSLKSAIQSGLGFGILPDYMAKEESGLIVVPWVQPIRLDVWMVVHSGLKDSARVRAVADFVIQAMRGE